MTATFRNLVRDRRCLALIGVYAALQLWWVWAVPARALAFPGLVVAHGVWEPGAWPRWLAYAWLLTALPRARSASAHPLSLPRGRLAVVRLAIELATLVAIGAAISALGGQGAFHVEHALAALGAALAAGTGTLLLLASGLGSGACLLWLTGVELAFLATPVVGPGLLLALALGLHRWQGPGRPC